MKRLLLASTACLGWAVAAQAADLPARAMAPVVAVPPAFTWTGFYVGANAGYAFQTRRHEDNNLFGLNRQIVVPTGAGGFFATGPSFAGFPAGTPALPVTPNAFAGSVLTPFGNDTTFFNNGRRRRDGFTGGGQIGYNWQLTPGAGLVIGFEADAQFADLNRRGNFELFGAGNGIGGFGFGGNTVANGTPVGVQTGAVPVTFAGPIIVQGGGGAPTFFTAGAPVGGGPVASPTPAIIGTTGPITIGAAAGTPNVPGSAVLAAGVGGAVTFIDPTRNVNSSSQRGIDWFGTVRGRLGYGFNRALLYVTGGLAYGGSDRNDHFANGFGFGSGGVGGFGLGGNCTGANDCRDRIRFGWTAGAGLEYAFTDQWSVKLEGLYVNLEDRRGSNNNFAVFNGPVPYARDAGGNTYFAPAAALGNNGFFNNRSREFEFAVVRVGLNYHFNFMAPTPAPVVARY